MTTPTHTISAAYIALIVSGVNNAQTSLIIVALLSAAILDLDHLYFILKDPSIAKRGKLHKARSILHELFGFVVIGVLMLIIGLFNQQLAIVIGLAMMIHLAEDMVVGISIPFNPIDMTEVKLLPQNVKLKAILDISTIVIFGVLWIKFLSGQV